MQGDDAVWQGDWKSRGSWVQATWARGLGGICEAALSDPLVMSGEQEEASMARVAGGVAKEDSGERDSRADEINGSGGTSEIIGRVGDPRSTTGGVKVR